MLAEATSCPRWTVERRRVSTSSIYSLCVSSTHPRWIHGLLPSSQSTPSTTSSWTSLLKRATHGLGRCAGGSARSLARATCHSRMPRCRLRGEREGGGRGTRS
jgi:hypothetical protein